MTAAAALTQVRNDGRLFAGAIAFAATALVLMALPLVPLGERTGVVTAVVVGLFLSSLGFGAAALGAGRVVLAALAVVPLALAVEVVGSRTGFPFGDYRYTGELRPTVAGVPAIVPLAWFAMGLPAWEVGRRLAGATWARVAAGAVALTAWDLFLDPQMVREGYWRWAPGGAYRTVPLTNFLGWLAVSAVVMAVFAALDARARDARSPALLVVYAFLAVMETVGFLFLFGDPIVGLVGGAVMLPLAFVAWRRG